VKFLLIFVLFFSFNLNAAYCLTENQTGQLVLDSVSVENCSSGMILLSKTDYELINQDAIISTLKDLFEFSSADFALFNAICLVGFIVGHSLGRVNRLLGKV
jgi:hypothetical protein